MPDDLIASGLALVRERQARASAREGDAALWIGAMGRLADEDVPRLLAAVDEVLALPARWEAKAGDDEGRPHGDALQAAVSAARARLARRLAGELRAAVLGGLTGEQGEGCAPGDVRPPCEYPLDDPRHRCVQGLCNDHAGRGRDDG